jgi:ribonuclease J
VADAAKAADREVVVVGRAMERVVQVARETGYLDGVQNFRGADYYGHFPPDKVLALCTGSQGEPRAALARIANDDHPQVTLNKGDCVIFSSRTIPGNEKAVGAIINGLVSQGIEVITDRTDLVHVSGHPRRDELRDMISWVRPQILIPVHGEALHLSEHAKLARTAGVPKVLTCRNGDLVKLGPGDPASSTNCRRAALQGRQYPGGFQVPRRGRAAADGICRLRLRGDRHDRQGRTGRRSRG